MATQAPALSTQVIGQAESALGAILEPLLDQAELTFPQWLVLVITSASGDSVARGELVQRISTSRKLPSVQVLSALEKLAVAGLVETTADADVTVALTPVGLARFQDVRGKVDEITGRLFDLPADDLVVAGRVLSIVTARANAEIARIGI
jgi:DNA-binding MarR family transcriptional regulator